jgi:hypothetical protein
MSQKSSVPQAISFVSQVLKRDKEQFSRGSVIERHARSHSRLFVLELLQRHRFERGSVADATLRELDDLPGDETRCGIVLPSASMYRIRF